MCVCVREGVGYSPIFRMATLHAGIKMRRKYDTRVGVCMCARARACVCDCVCVRVRARVRLCACVSEKEKKARAHTHTHHLSSVSQPSAISN